MAEIRQLSASGLTVKEILAMGYSRSTIFAALRSSDQGRRLPRTKIEAALAEITSLQIEILELLRQSFPSSQQQP